LGATLIATIMLTDLSCGTLTVLARLGDSKGGKLRLFVVSIAPGANRPDQDPVLSLGGDLGAAPDYVTLGAQAAGLGREVIVLNVRGTGRSQPSLVCPEVEALPSSPVSVPVDDPRTRGEFLVAIAACHDRLVSQEVDLSAFDLQEIAADADDLRTALGIGRWNVLALGTTSRIALESSATTPGPCARWCWTAPSGQVWIRSSRASRRPGMRSPSSSRHVPQTLCATAWHRTLSAIWNGVPAARRQTLRGRLSSEGPRPVGGVVPGLAAGTAFVRAAAGDVRSARDRGGRTRLRSDPADAGVPAGRW
jgi:pimeloyl-ACP methyl ester carboxylesterase